MKTKKKQRKTNLIKALEQELYHYKHQRVPICYIATELAHYKFSTLIDDKMLEKYGTDEMEEYAKDHIVDDFRRELGNIIPIDVEDVEDFRQKRYVVDIWVK